MSDLHIPGTQSTVFHDLFPSVERQEFIVQEIKERHKKTIHECQHNENTSSLRITL